MSPERAKLAWQCRRGMLELDLLLQGFLERGYDTLDDGSRAAFAELLCYPDNELLAALMGQVSLSQAVHNDLAAKIRRTAAA